MREAKVQESTKIKGDFAEKLSCQYLLNNGFIIIEQNFYAKKFGEIDIIAKKDGIYHFCEVKSGQDYESAVNNLSSAKLAKFRKSVEYYLQTKKLDVAFAIDALIVVGYEIEFLENITL